MKMTKYFSFLIIGLFILSAVAIIVPTVAAPRVQLIEGQNITFDILKGKPPGTGGGGDTAPQEKDWGYMRIGSDAARGATTGVAVVAVLDTGVDPSHGDLSGVLIACFSGIARLDLPCDDRKVKDDQGHGTHVAGTIAALDNNQDMVGVAAGHVQIISGKVLGRRGGDWYDLAWSIRHATDLGADVISMSLGGDITNYPSIQAELQSAINYAYNAGVAVVAAAGNEGDATCSAADEEPSWPAKSNNVIAVGATGLYKADNSGWATEWTGVEKDVFPCFSNSGSYVDIAAPGVYITSLKKGGGVTDMHGTSMATPHVSAVIALIMANGNSNVFAENRILSTAINLNYPATLQGAGLLNAEGSV